MKTIGIYKYDNQLYSGLEEKLKLLDIHLRSLEDNEVNNDIDLYVFDIDNPAEFEKIKFDRPFIVISSLNNSVYLRKSLKLGALDYIYKPFTDIELTIKRLQRLLEKNQDANQVIVNSQTNKYNKIIDIEIKRAHRGRYPLTIASIGFESSLNKETLIKLLNKIKTVLRESDSCMLYPDDSVIIVLPFTDNCGAIIVSRKIIDLLNNLGYKCFCLCSEYPKDGETREELISNLGKNIDTRVIYK